MLLFDNVLCQPFKEMQNNCWEFTKCKKQTNNLALALKSGDGTHQSAAEPGCCMKAVSLPLKRQSCVDWLDKTAVVLVQASRLATSSKTLSLPFSFVLFPCVADLVSALTFRPRSTMTPGGSCVCPGNTKGKTSALQTYCHGTFLLRMPPLMPTYKKNNIYIFFLYKWRHRDGSWKFLDSCSSCPPSPSGKIKTTSTGLLCSNTSSIRRVSRFP